MRDALMIFGFIVVFGGWLLMHHAGVTYSLRVMGNWCYSLAFAVDHFRAELSRMNAEAKRMA
jgi:hypothetical protein